jgi:lipoate-protein ligase A
MSQRAPAVTCCDFTLPSPEENLACDEALLAGAEAGHTPATLRFWMATRHFVVVGYGNDATREVELNFCRAEGIPVLRRCSGGGTVLQGPGVLNYALVLSAQSPPCDSITSTNRAIMERHRVALSHLTGRPVSIEGHTDLAIEGRKFSGNAQRRGRRFLLFHGSFLLDLDLKLMERALRMPSRQPDYRASRTHAAFVMNLHIPAARLKEKLQEAWEAQCAPLNFRRDELEKLIREKYGRPEWNSRA